MATALPYKDDMALPTYCPEKAQRLDESAPKRTMSSRRLAVTFFFCFLVTYGLAAAISPRYRVPCHYGRHDQVPEPVVDEPQGEAPQDSLSTLLNSVSPDALHRMLHDYFPDRYQHGVYETDAHAVHAVHADNPALAGSIAKIAKRQETNSTSSTPPSDTTTSPTSTPSSTSEKPTSTSKPTTTETTTPKTTTPTTTSKPPTSTTTKAPETTDPTTTPTSSAKRSSSLVTATFTSTQANGDVTVVTATSFVEVNPTSTGTTGGGGSLQTGNAAPGTPVPLPAWAGIMLGGLLLI